MRTNIIAGLIASLVAVSLLLVIYDFGVMRKQLKVEYKRGYLAGQTDEADKYKGVDIGLAKKMISEQQASRVNMKRFANGEIINFTVHDVDTNENKAVARITATYINGKTLEGTADLIYRDGYWYLIRITQKKK